MGFTPKQLVLIFGMLLTGTINTVSKKMQLDCWSVGYYNHSANDTQVEHKFNKPWFQTLLMFLGETLCLFGFIFIRYRKRKRLQRESVFREIGDAELSGILATPIFNWLFILPAFCDLLGTTIAGIGLLYVDASIWQMMRGSLIIFAGILSIIFLKRRLRCFHWTGMCLTVVGLALVGTKSVFSGHSLSHTGIMSAVGVALVLVGAFTSACQMTVEEVFIKNRGFHPLQAVGMEGIFGSLLMIVVALPSVHFIPGSDLNGSYENVLDALYQIKNNTLLCVNCVIYILSIAFFNYFGLSITRYLSAVHRTLIDALRTTFVWIISLVLYYTTNGQFGEPLDYHWVLIQLDGFAFLVIGTLIYNKVMDLSFIRGCGDSTDALVTEEALVHESNESSVADGDEVPILPQTATSCKTPL